MVKCRILKDDGLNVSEIEMNNMFIIDRLVLFTLPGSTSYMEKERGM